MRIGIISDIHEDIEALRAALKLLDKCGVDEIVCLGDLVGFSPRYYDFEETRDANAVVDLVRKRCSCVLLGNHDLFAIRQPPRCQDFFTYPPDWYQLSLPDRIRVADGKLHLYGDSESPCGLTAENISYLAALPEFDVKNVGDHKILLSHYAFPDCTGSSTLAVRSPQDLGRHFSAMAATGCTYGFSGHDHCDSIMTYTANGTLAARHRVMLPRKEVAWLHGPAVVSQSGFVSAVWIYNTMDRSIEIISLY